MISINTECDVTLEASALEATTLLETETAVVQE